MTILNVAQHARGDDPEPDSPMPFRGDDPEPDSPAML